MSNNEVNLALPAPQIESPTQPANDELQRAELEVLERVNVREVYDRVGPSSSRSTDPTQQFYEDWLFSYVYSSYVVLYIELSSDRPTYSFSEYVGVVLGSLSLLPTFNPFLLLEPNDSFANFINLRLEEIVALLKADPTEDRTTRDIAIRGFFTNPHNALLAALMHQSINTPPHLKDPSVEPVRSQFSRWKTESPGVNFLVWAFDWPP